jgi:predicted dienelactone hydrolase
VGSCQPGARARRGRVHRGLPAHRGDNYQDSSTPGPESWRRRPVEISHAIDVVGQDPRFRPLLALDKVGMYGMSAGGHTALSLAGGRWSPASFRQYCESHIGEDFQSCVGLITRLRGNILDGPKQTLALWVIRYRFSDATWQEHTDPRVAAIVAAVPYAADFDMASLAAPRVPVVWSPLRGTSGWSRSSTASACSELVRHAYGSRTFPTGGMARCSRPCRPD